MREESLDTNKTSIHTHTHTHARTHTHTHTHTHTFTGALIHDAFIFNTNLQPVGFQLVPTG